MTTHASFIVLSLVRRIHFICKVRQSHTSKRKNKIIIKRCTISMNHHKIVTQEKIEDTKGVKRHHKSKWDRQHNGQKKKEQKDK